MGGIPGRLMGVVTGIPGMDGIAGGAVIITSNIAYTTNTLKHFLYHTTDSLSG